MLLLGAGLGWLLGYPSLGRVRFGPEPILWGAVATVPTVLLLFWILQAGWKPVARLLDEIRQTVVPLFRKCSFAHLVAISILAGLAEEVLFRAVLQTALSDLLTPAGGLLAASLLFGLGHPITPTYAVLAGLFGLYLGGLFLAFDNLLVPVVVHALYDLVALTYLKWR